MMSDYQEHCARAFKIYGDHVYGTLCTAEHFTHWLREQKAKASKGQGLSCAHTFDSLAPTGF